MKYTYLFILACVCTVANAQDYAVSRIPAELLKNANMVKRVESVRFEVFNTHKAVTRTKLAVTILNEKADYYSGMREYYDKLQEISSIEGSLYDETGKLVKKLKPKDIQDISAVDDISMMDDNRMKSHNFYYKNYPYTVEYEIELIHNNTFIFPRWYSQDAEHQSVVQSTLEVIVPADYQLRHRSYNYKTAVAENINNGKKTYQWQVTNLPAIKREFAGPKWHEMTTVVTLAPTQFELQGYKGDMTTWKEFGKFLFELSKQRDELPEPIKLKVKELTAGVADPKQKIAVLYQYLQSNTRYISIQLGIGGWQPFEASYVAKKGYGDCKALSNYMYSLLKEAGIPSKYALIRAGKGEFFLQEDFPSNQFNHAILCVPLQKDTVWLECTSQTSPAGYMGEFTGNRKALLIDENGGTLVSTPIYDAAENSQHRKTYGKVLEDGSMTINVESRYRGMQQDWYHGLIHQLSKDKIKERLQEAFELPTYNIDRFNYEEKKSALPEITETLDITVSGYATITGKRLFILPNVLNRARTKLTAEDERKYEIRMDVGYTDIDTVEIEIPAGYQVEAMPQPVELKTRFGSYASTVSVKDNKITYIRKRVQLPGSFPATEFKNLANYYSEIYKADRSKMVLVKKEG
jgi:hypothetical protein